ncbi:putative sodium- and chloride-dependent glycine transporter 2-like [Apostichopus japonicus]|uniref:Putative sodium-and chloride-dependent glycine transporter 2-like n=1 Tax=Stichopus japonicus TaxID=307972 RepID=A0A2G8KYV4_STIJA|nr:putative sodium- and chloride-dependent glycine transporter 2-like [Apostichopus japonicus]
MGLTLPGHTEGIKFFITPQWEYLAKPRSWLNAAVQIFYSLGASWGGVITLSSFNKFHNNTYIDSLVISIANSLTSIFAGFVIFSYLGFMSHELKRDVSKVVSQGMAGFYRLPEAITLLPVPTLWAILFFLMLLSLALDTHFASTEAVVTAIVDLLPERLRKHKMMVLLAYCIVGYLFGLICTTEAGPYWANLIDQSSASFAILLFAFLECVSISWIYGFRRFRNDIRSMIGDKMVDHPTFWGWIFQWSFVTPFILAIVMLVNFINWSDPTYNGPYPIWARGIGWMISSSTLMWIPIFIIYRLTSNSGSITERFQKALMPEETWGPIRTEDRQHAWETHEKHGTTMGGRKNLADHSTEMEAFTKA